MKTALRSEDLFQGESILLGTCCLMLMDLLPKISVHRNRLSGEVPRARKEKLFIKGWRMYLYYSNYFCDARNQITDIFSGISP
jgi:hypothetical protein